ncbi:MAG: tetratricopeptide repeat protein [Acidimicrobiia bacterium]|nr:tetratricopeptide repeat protein [Acidimicrobiia bacterium]
MPVTRVVPLPAGCAALLAVLVYLNALDNPFVYDDFRLIVENPAILTLDVRGLMLRDLTRPVVNLSYALDTALWGPRAPGYHATSVLLHAVNVVLVFWVAFLAAGDARRRDLSSTAIAFATAALFAVHPMMTQAVGYIASRSEVLYTTFFLLAFLAGARWMRAGGGRWWAACVALWIVAMLAKEPAAMLPLVLIAYDRLVLDDGPDERRRRWRGLELPMLAIMAVAGGVRLAVLMRLEYGGQAAPDLRFALIAIDAFWRYLLLFFVPQGQSVFHDVPAIRGLFDVRALLGMGGLAALLAAAWALRRVHALLPLGIVWFVLLLVPSGVLATFGRGEPMAEHRAYLPAAGLFLAWGFAFGALWARAGRDRTIAATAAAILLVSLAALTIVRNVVWDNPVLLAQEATVRSPGHWVPRMLLAEALRQSGRCGDAVREYRVVTAARPQDPFAYGQMARCLIVTGRLSEAEPVLRRVRDLSPASPDGSMGLGVLAILRGRPGESRVHFGRVLERDPGHAQAQRLLAFIDNTLPDAERRRVCQELGATAGGALAVDRCRN